MANVWIERIYNFTPHEITMNTDDGTWWPVVDKKKYRGGQYRDPIPVKPDAVLECEHFFVPWIDYGRLRIDGPEGGLEFSVGPISTNSGDYLRGFDAKRKEVLRAEMGPRGGNAWGPSVSLHLVFDEKPRGMEFTIWSAQQVGHDVLTRAGEELLKAAPEIIDILVPG